MQHLVAKTDNWKALPNNGNHCEKWGSSQVTTTIKTIVQFFNGPGRMFVKTLLFSSVWWEIKGFTTSIRKLCLHVIYSEACSASDKLPTSNVDSVDVLPHLYFTDKRRTSYFSLFNCISNNNERDMSTTSKPTSAPISRSGLRKLPP